MAQDKKAVLLYADIIFTVEKLTDENAGKLFKHFLRYINDQNPTPENEVIDLVFEPIKHQLKRDLKRWETIREVRTEAGRKGGVAKASKAKQKGSKGKQNVANVAVSVNVNDNVINNIYTLYPSKCPNRETSTGKTAKDKDKIKTLLQTISPEHLTATITRYVNECRRDNAYMKNFGTFLNNLPDYGTTDTPIVEQYDYSKHDTSLRTMMKIPVTVERLIAKGATLEGLQKRLKELEQ